MTKKKEPPYAPAYGVSILVTLLANYFLISKLNLNSTVNVALNFLVFTIIIGSLMYFLEK